MFPSLRKMKTEDALGEHPPTTMERMIGPVRSRDEFVLLYSKLIEELRPGVKVALTGETTIAMTDPSGKTATTFLDNLWIQIRHAEDSSELIEKHVTAMLAMLEPEPVIERSQIIPIVKDEGYVRENMDKFVYDHLAADLYCVYAIDFPDRIVSMKEQTLVDLATDRASLRDLAIENLSAILPQAECGGPGPWYWLSAGGDYEASLLLFDNVWDQVATMVDGDIVAAAPARDTLLFTGSNSQEGIAFLRQQSEEIVKGGHHVISSTLIRRRDGAWSAFN